MGYSPDPVVPRPPMSQLLVLAALAAAVLTAGCQRSDGAAAGREVLVDRAAATGLDFVHFNGMSGEYYFCETVGSGGALVDVDNDGDLDVYLVQGRMPAPDGDPAAAIFPPAKGEPLRDRLYRNDLEIAADGSRRLRFTDVTAASGLENPAFGMGVAAGDFDNDGRTDLYVTNFGPNRLWRNNGPDAGGTVTFTDVTAASGTGDRRWSTSAAFVDVDADGRLDLYVVNYVDFRIANHETCVNELGEIEYCGPLSYEPETDRLFRNLGVGADGLVTFADVSAAAGLVAAPGPGLGVVSTDLDGDGRIDVVVANDQARNHLWINRTGAGGPDDERPGRVRRVRLHEEALLRGSAVDAEGMAQASMGVAAGDVDNDGDDDLFMTHLLREVNTLYLNDGSGYFADRTSASGLGTPSIGYTAFGVALLDVDNDGWLDVLTVNGEVRTIPELRAAGDPWPLAQPNQLFLNRGGTFVEAGERAPVLAEPRVSRGAVVGDVDNDGDADVMVTNAAGAVQLLINQVGADSHWLGLRLVDGSGRDALGARAGLDRDGVMLWRQARTDGSFLAANDPRVLFGRGEDGAPAAVTVEWPSGRRETWEDLAVDRYHTLVEGKGRPSVGGA